MKPLILTFLLSLLFSACQLTPSDDTLDQNSTIIDDTPTTLPDDTNLTQDDNTTQETNTTLPDDANLTSDDNTTTIENNTTLIEENTTLTCPTYSDAILRGKALYEANCKLCHNADAKSGVMDIRGALSSDIEWAMQNINDMIEKGFASKLSDANVSDISAYLIEIKTNPDIATYVEGECGTTTISKETLGSKLFFDKNLSLTKTLSCASCHNPARAFIDARFLEMNGTHPVNGALSLGDDNTSLGGRNAPTAAYAMFSPAFSKHSDGNYSGGQFHDGRAATLKEQAKGPFLDPAEMMMPSAGHVVERVKANSEYHSAMQSLYGTTVFDDNSSAYDAIADAISAFEQSTIFAPFDSKYDRSKLATSDADYYAMTPQELEGYTLFFSDATHCKRCHSINSSSEKTSKELFTNYHYENIGRPKNLQALQVRDSNTSKIDLGLGGRSDINDTRHYAKFKVPTLRNVAVTPPYMSNGVFNELYTVITFYNHISGHGNHTINPETNQTWGEPEYADTINRELNATIELSDTQIHALIAFLKLLTDKQYESLLQ